MKKIFTSLLPIIALTVLISLDSTTSYAQERREGVRVSPNAAVSQNIGATVVNVTYGRPGLRDEARKSGSWTMWRTGANESAAITFSTDVMFEEKW